MTEQLASIRLRKSIHNALLLEAAKLSDERKTRITIRSLLEEGITSILALPLSEWVQWANKSLAQTSASDSTSEPSISFRINADYARQLGILAAQITVESRIPVTRVHLIEEAGQRMLGQIQAEREELEALT